MVCSAPAPARGEGDVGRSLNGDISGYNPQICNILMGWYCRACTVTVFGALQKKLGDVL